VRHREVSSWRSRGPEFFINPNTAAKPGPKDAAGRLADVHDGKAPISRHLCVHGLRPDEENDDPVKVYPREGEG
jgi:hypothetical protein